MFIYLLIISKDLSFKKNQISNKEKNFQKNICVIMKPTTNKKVYNLIIRFLFFLGLVNNNTHRKMVTLLGRKICLFKKD